MTLCNTARSKCVLSLLGAMLVVSACGRPSAPPADPAVVATATVDSVVLDTAALENSGVVVDAVQTRTRTDQIVAPGLLAIDETRTARVGSLQEGQIIESRAQIGDRVRVNQVLATMHSHALHDAWAGYRKAIADHRRLEKELAYAVSAHQRAERLYADKAISLQDVQRAEVDRGSASETLAMGTAEVNRSIEELEHVGVSIATSTEDDPLNPADESTEQIPVRSPIGGVVLERLVTPGTTVVPGTPLFVVSELSRLWAIAEIDESRLSQVRAGRTVDIQVAAYPNEHFVGTITFISDVVNPKTRRITVRSTVPNADLRLKPDMFATMALGESEPRLMVVVPRAAVQTIAGHTSVFMAQAGGRFVPRQVDLGTEEGGLLEVKAGLAPGDRIAVAGSFVLKSELLKPAAEGGN